MDLKRWILAAAGAFAVIVICDVVIHHVWLGEVYRATAGWWRPADEMASLSGLMYVSEALLAMLLAFIYTKGYEKGKGDIEQGFRFGILMGLLLALPSSVMKIFVYPYPLDLVLSWMAGTIVEVTLAGMVIGFLYAKPLKRKK